MSNGDKQTPTKLPIFKSVSKAYQITFTNLSEFARIVWLWTIILIIATVLVNWFLWPLEMDARSTTKASSKTIATITYLIAMLITASVAVSWHRKILINERVDSSFSLRWDGLVVHYFAWLMLAGLVPQLIKITLLPIMTLLFNALPSALVYTLATPAFIVISFGLWFVFVRTMLFFPGIALGNKQTLIEVWNRTRGNEWQLMAGSLLVSLPIFIFFLLLILLLGISDEPTTQTAFIIRNCFVQISTLFASVFGITFLSIAYRHFFSPFNTNNTTN